MIVDYLEYISKIYKYIDAIIMVNKDGIIEYSAMMSEETNRLHDEGIVGQKLSKIYPYISREDSTHYRVLKTGQPIINEKQTLLDHKGKNVVLINSTFPIVNEGEVIGTIEIGTFPCDNNYEKSKANNTQSRLFTLSDIITNNPKLLEIKRKIIKLAMSNSSIMIHGETGTGKELIAQSIHNSSTRSKKPFIPINCSAIPSELMESTLFGTLKGSFTGAEDRKGLFEMADGGTLFLDELNSMNINLQPKILKAIEEKRFRRVGGQNFLSVDVRIISAMNVDPLKAMENHVLRKDLYFRLSVVQISLPPLRERKEDIILLADYYIDKFNSEQSKKVAVISDIVKNVLTNYSWPGNIRELRNIIESAHLMADNNVITLNDISENVIYNNKETEFIKGNLAFNKSLPEQLKNFEDSIIKKALASSNSITEAAEKLKISRQSLRYKIAKYNL